MEVLIRLERDKPPAGTVLRLWEQECFASDASEARIFVGWLGLLRVLSELMREADEPASS